MPPCLCVTAVRAKVDDIANGFGFLPDGGLELRLVNENFARPVFLKQPSGVVAILAPALVTQLDDLGVVVKPLKGFLQRFETLGAIMKTCRILQEKSAQLAGVG